MPSLQHTVNAQRLKLSPTPTRWDQILSASVWGSAQCRLNRFDLPIHYSVRLLLAHALILRHNRWTPHQRGFWKLGSFQLTVCGIQIQPAPGFGVPRLIGYARAQWLLFNIKVSSAKKSSSHTAVSLNDSVHSPVESSSQGYCSSSNSPANAG